MPIVVVAPTRRELGGVRSSADGSLVASTVGLGRGAASSLQALLEQTGASLVVSLGFAGALRPGMNTGDIVNCERIVNGGTGAATIELDRDPTALFSRGTLLTTPRVLLTSEEKRAHGRESGADVVDLEGYWLAEVAQAHGVPFVVVRAVIDRVQDDLPSMVAAIVAGGGAHEVRHAARALLRPREAVRLPGLAARSWIAAQSLRRAARIILATPLATPAAAP